jgi:hypothetical protein
MGDSIRKNIRTNSAIDGRSSGAVLSIVASFHLEASPAEMDEWLLR